jgi:hypothetical protein
MEMGILFSDLRPRCTALCVDLVAELYSCAVLLARSKVPRLVFSYITNRGACAQLARPPASTAERAAFTFNTQKKQIGAHATAQCAAALYLERPNSI